MAKPRLTAIVAVLWSTTAIGSWAVAETQLNFVGPARRQQPRPASEVKFTGLPPAPSVDDGSPKILGSLEPMWRVAAKWHTNLLLEPLSDQSDDTPETDADAAATELPQPGHDVEVLVVPQGEPVDAGAGQEHVCFVPSPMESLSTDIALPAGKLPTDLAALCAAKTPRVGDPRLEGGWAMVQFHWAATAMHHRPLYFEETNAERYGYTPSYLLQPIFSGVRFFATIPALPYKMVVDCPRDCIYTLGHYRPGSCVPRRWHRLPLRLSAATVEVGVIAGLIILLP